MNAAPTYLTGEPIQIGDTVRIDGELWSVDLINIKDSQDFVACIGEGVMLINPKSGSMSTKFQDEDLFFVCRARV